MMQSEAMRRSDAMNFNNLIRQHWAALRALLVLTVITGILYPLVVWGVSFLPGLHAKAEGSIVNVSGKPVASKQIGRASRRERV